MQTAQTLRGACEITDPAFILNRLSFPSMTDRHDDIPKAHKRTFEWIQKSPETSDIYLGVTSTIGYVAGRESIGLMAKLLPVNPRS